MNIKLRKVLAALLTGVIISTFAACGSEKQTDSEKTQPDTATAQTSAVPSENREPITLTLGGDGITVKTGGEQSYPICKEVEKLFGIKLNIVAGLQSSEKQKIIIASGDIPDIFLINKDDMLSLVKGEMITDLDSVIESKAPNVKKYGASAIEFSKKYYSNGTEKLFAVPTHLNTGAPSMLIDPFVRWDYYKEIGAPQINSFDDMLKVISDIYQKHPKNADGKPYFGIATNFEGRLWSYCVPYGFMIAGRHYRDGQMLDYDIANDKYTSLVSDPNSSLWNSVKVLNKLYKMKLLDPEAFTMKGQAMEEKIKQDRYISFWGSWSKDPANAELKSKGINTAYVPMYPGENTAYVSTYAEPVGSINYLWTVSKKCKDVDRAIELLNYCYSFEGSRNIYQGMKGMTWDDENGVGKFKEEYLKEIQADPNATEKYGSAGQLLGLMGLNLGYYDEELKQYVDLNMNTSEIVKNYNDYEKEYCSKFGIQTLVEPLTKIKAYTHKSIAMNIVPSSTADEKRVFSQIENYLVTNLPKIIMTAKTDEDISAAMQNVIEDLKGMGLEAFEKHWADEVTKAQATEKEILGK